MDKPAPTAEISWSNSRFAGSALRTRFRPRGRIRPLFFTLAPIIDVFLIVIAILFCIRGGGLLPHVTLRSDVLTPGIRVDLPAAEFTDGSDSTMLLVVNPLPAAPAAEPVDAAAPAPPPAESPALIVFFDETRFNLSLSAARADFRRTVTQHLELHDDAAAVLFVDRAVPYGELADLLTLLRETGVPQICFATKTR